MTPATGPDTMSERGQITRLLGDLGAGDGEALERLMPIVYDELRSLAHRELARERPGHTLQTTALVHEAYLKLIDLDGTSVEDRLHFYRICSRAMRQVLVSYARRKGRKKRGEGRPNVPIDDVVVAARERPDDLIGLDDALSKLEAEGERYVRVVECRFFGGLSVDETAQALGVSPATVKRDWTFARAWLARAMEVEV